MSHDRPFEELLADWLSSDTPPMIPDRVLSTTFERTSGARQVRSRPRRLPFPLIPSSPRLAMLTVGVGVVAIVGVVTGAIVLGPADAQRAQVGAGAFDTCAAAQEPASEPVPLGLTLVCLDASGHVDLGLPRDAASVDMTADGSRITFLTADASVGFCGRCASGPPHQAIVAIGRTVGDFVAGDEANGLKTSPHPMPAWSPDGSSIAFRDAAGDLHVEEVGPHENVIGDVGPGMRNVAYERLTDDPASDEFPAWSPDGSVILYSNMGAGPANADGYSPTQEIWSVSAIGGEPTQLTQNEVIDTQPDVSTDGTVAFMRDAQAWTMELDGSDQRLLEATTDGDYFAPRWSPDGTKLALLRSDPSGRTMAHPDLGIGDGMPLLEVVVLDLATNEITSVGTRVVTDLNPPSWMPDGSALLVNVYDITTPGVG